MAFWSRLLNKTDKQQYTLKDMRFNIEFFSTTERINTVRFCITEDSSFISDIKRGDYTVLLNGNWRIELIVDSTTGECLTVHCFLQTMQILKKRLSIPQCTYGRLILSADSNLEPYSGCHYYPFDDNIYFDDERCIMCIGDPNIIGENVKIADSIVAVVDKLHLSAIFIDLENSAIQCDLKKYLHNPQKDYCEL